MDDEGANAGEDSYDRRRPSQDRDKSVKAGTLADRLRLLFRALDRAGFDPDSPEDMERWSDQQRRMDDAAEKLLARTKRRGQFGLLLAGAIATAVAAAASPVLTWLIHLIPSAWRVGTGPPP